MYCADDSLSYLFVLCSEIYQTVMTAGVQRETDRQTKRERQTERDRDRENTEYGNFIQ